MEHVKKFQLETATLGHGTWTISVMSQLQLY